jgi:hypothetical protein
MSSRKEQKEALRRERLERERQAQEAARRKRLVGYGAGGVLALAALAIVAVLVLSGSGGDGGGGGDKSVLPDDGKVPAQKNTDFQVAVKAAGCEVKSEKAKSREHTGSLSDRVKYDSDPPMSGKHYLQPASDSAYDDPPQEEELVHSMEHGRMIIWFKSSLPEEARANLKALYDQDSYQLILTPHDSMPYAVAATAWTRDPTPNGTGHLVGCKRFTNADFDVLQTFRDEFRGRGPEAVQ